jgi:hypothetical protein
VIALFAASWLALVAGVAYKSNHAWPSHRSIQRRLIDNNRALAVTLSERTARVLLERAQARALAARRAARRRLVAGLLSVLGALVLVNAPTPTERRRHGSGEGTAFLPVGRLVDVTPSPTARTYGRHSVVA